MQQIKGYKKYFCKRKKKEGGESIDDRTPRNRVPSEMHKTLVNRFPEQNNWSEVMIMELNANVCDEYEDKRPPVQMHVGSSCLGLCGRDQLWNEKSLNSIFHKVIVLLSAADVQIPQFHPQKRSTSQTVNPHTHTPCTNAEAATIHTASSC